MNIPQYIIELLKESDTVVVDGFGVFSLKTKSALVHDDGLISPPSKTISFTYDDHAKNNSLISYLSKKENISILSVEIELKKEVNKWKEQLDNTQNLQIEGIGSIFKGHHDYIFIGEKIETQVSDFYGLEEINLSEIKTNTTPELEISEDITQNPSDYKFNNSILWAFLIAIPVLGILYLGIAKQDIIFGKKSIEKLAVKPLSEIKTIPSVKDSASTQKPDSTSVKKDSATSNIKGMNESNQNHNQ